MALLLLLHLMLTYTKFGKAIRATSNNIDLARSCGIDSDRVISLTWFIAGLLTAVAGVGLVLQESTLSPTTGFTELFVIFGAVILGGIGRPYGAMLGALIIGVLTEVAGAYVNAAYKTSIAFGVVVLLLLFRPQGLYQGSGADQLMLYFLTDLLVLGCINSIMVVGLNLQYGYSGLLNFAFYVYVAIGAYVAAITTMGPSTTPGITYALGWTLPWWAGLIIGGIVASIFGALVFLLTVRRLRSDYLAIVTVAVAFIMWNLIDAYQPLFDGDTGLFNVPQITGHANISTEGYSAIMVALSAACLALFVWIARRMFRSPFGRLLRSIREDEQVTAAFGRVTWRPQIAAFTIGSFFGGIAGGLLIFYISAWSPAAFLPIESFILLAALIVGGSGNYWGSLLGAFVLIEGLGEISRYVPSFGNGADVGALRAVVIGLVLILVLRYRPEGIIPERWLKWYRTTAGARAGRRRRRSRHGELRRGQRSDDRGPAVAHRGRGRRPGPRAAGDGGRTSGRGPAGRERPAGHPRRGVLLRRCPRGGRLQLRHQPGNRHRADRTQRRRQVDPGGNPERPGLTRSRARSCSTGKAWAARAAAGMARLGVARTFQTARVLSHLPVLENVMIAAPAQRGEGPLAALLWQRGWRDQETALREEAVELLGWLGLSSHLDRPALAVRRSAAADGDRPGPDGPPAAAADGRAHRRCVPGDQPADRPPRPRDRGDRRDGAVDRAQHGVPLPGGRRRGGDGGRPRAHPRTAGGGPRT